MEGGGLDGMMGVLPFIVVGGMAMHMTDRMMGPNSRFGQMSGEQERYQPKERTKMKMKGKGLYGKMGGGGLKMGSMGYGGFGNRRRKKSGVNNPSGLTSMMKKEGSKVKMSVAYEGHKLGSGSMGSLPGVGKVTPGKISSIGIGGNKIYDSAKKSMKARTMGKL